MWSKNLFRRRQESNISIDEDSVQLLAWSLDTARRNESALPTWCRMNMQIFVAWNAIPIMVGFKHDELAGLIPDRSLRVRKNGDRSVDMLQDLLALLRRVVVGVTSRRFSNSFRPVSKVFGILS